MADLNRRAYIDWARGVAVLLMIEAHTLDAWTRPADRATAAYQWAIIVGGMGAPLFLLLAGGHLLKRLESEEEERRRLFSIY